MKVNQCDRCKAIIQNNEEYYPYNFGHLTNKYSSSNYLSGDLCLKCFELFEGFLEEENSCGTN